ncbi:hypothetical protein XENOCAPTIV_014705 [Xenoophorus captivus]|uniref:Uncharacterized protein n=1 Tax=Xenoophorus captivus TaxID=1517983 RepID=A0ABV0Q5Y6_9TELE
MESGGESLLRSRNRANNLDGGSNPGRRPQGNGDNHITSNGKIVVEHVISKKLQLKRKAEGLKDDLLRQFESQVHDFMDSLIEESASLESTPLPAAFSPLLSDKERSKLGYCISSSTLKRYKCSDLWPLSFCPFSSCHNSPRLASK